MTNSRKQSRLFFRLAAWAFMLTSVVGLIASIKIAFPAIDHSILPFEKIRPLHTLFPIAGVLAGLFGWLTFEGSERPQKSPTLLPKLSNALLILFVLGAFLSLILGRFSGREYFSWPPVFSIPLIISVSIMCYLLFKWFRSFSKKSPEGTWLVGFGIVFVLIGLSESLAWLHPFVGNNFVRDLTLQWHGIDTFFAGLNAALYGVGVFLLQKKPKPLRKKWLYAIAVFSLLFTFGHHHYTSPQPEFLKILAFIASMIAMFSFVKHLRAAKQKGNVNRKSRSVQQTLFRSVELWTIVSFGSGILFAIPQVNLLIHGTYSIVIHAMGSMIGVQMMLVFAAGFSTYTAPNKQSEKRIKLGVKLINLTLVLLWGIMGTVGVIEGVMRINANHYEIINMMENYLYLLPVLGMLLLTAIFLMSIELVSACRRVDKVNSNTIRSAKRQSFLMR